MTLKACIPGFPGSSDGKESACKVGDPSLIPGSRRSRGEGNGYPLQYSCLENPMDKGAWLVAVHGVTVDYGLMSYALLFLMEDGI